MAVVPYQPSPFYPRNNRLRPPILPFWVHPILHSYLKVHRLSILQVPWKWPNRCWKIILLQRKHLRRLRKFNYRLLLRIPPSLLPQMHRYTTQNQHHHQIKRVSMYLQNQNFLLLLKVMYRHRLRWTRKPPNPLMANIWAVKIWRDKYRFRVHGDYVPFSRLMIDWGRMLDDPGWPPHRLLVTHRPQSTKSIGK